MITKTHPAAYWLSQEASVGDFGAVVQTPDGLARVVAAPNLHGLARIRYVDGRLRMLNTREDAFTIIPVPTGPLRYLRLEYEQWAAARDQLERDRADRKAFDDSDDDAIRLLQQFASVAGLIQPGDGDAKGPVCPRCLATGWNFIDDPAHPVWCDSCRGTGHNPAPELEASPYRQCGWCDAELRPGAGGWQGRVPGPLDSWTDRCPVATNRCHKPA